MSYDQNFYDVIRDGAQRSVTAAIPIIVHHLGLTGNERVLDVGCGEGWWSDGFARDGCTVIGVDSGTTPHRPDSFTFIDRDVTLPLPFELVGEEGKPFDLVISLEVAEHLPPSKADGFIGELCAQADTVLFSAAIPGQGGTGHINEQWPDYWANLFHEHGFAVSGALRWHMWGHPDIENWYQQNILVAMRTAHYTMTHAPRDGGGEYTMSHPLFEDPLMAFPHRIVHPILYDARRSNHR
jgi:SAM-dependent methyltransferase